MLEANENFSLEVTRHPLWRRLESVISDYRNGAISRNTALENALNPLRSLMHRPSMAEGIDNATIDDVVQDMLIAFDQSILDEYDDQFPLKPYVDRWMTLIRKNYWRKSRREMPWTDFQSGGSPNERDQDIAGGSSASHDLVKAAIDEGLMADASRDVLNYDADVAMQEFTALMNRHGAPGQLLNDAKQTTEKSVGKKTSQPSGHTDDVFADHDELKRIQKRLELNREAFAARLGIGKSRLASYLYRAVLTVPEDVMVRARELEQGEAETVDELRELYARPMTEILLEWQKRYGLPTDEQDIACVLDVTVTTIRRWYKGTIRPGIDSIRKYERKARKAKLRT